MLIIAIYFTVSANLVCHFVSSQTFNRNKNVSHLQRHAPKTRLQQLSVGLAIYPFGDYILIGPVRALKKAMRRESERGEETRQRADVRTPKSD